MNYACITVDIESINEVLFVDIRMYIRMYRTILLLYVAFGM